MRVGAVQMRFRPAIRANVDVICDRIAAEDADVILFPECAVTGYNVDFSAISREDIEAALAEIAACARKKRINVLVGTPTFAGRKRFNSMVVFDRKGREVFRYHKIHLTPRDAKYFARGNSIAFFRIDGVPCTAIICHERRFPELVRLPVMMGAQILFHPNAGLDSLAVSKSKRGGKDGVVARAFENQIFYVFANSVGPQGNNLWSAGDSKIVAPSMETLAVANNRDEVVIACEIDVSSAGRKYAIEALQQPVFLRRQWRAMLAACRKALPR